jgi:hypothetical protein
MTTRMVEPRVPFRKTRDADASMRCMRFGPHETPPVRHIDVGPAGDLECCDQRLWPHRELLSIRVGRWTGRVP